MALCSQIERSRDAEGFRITGPFQLLIPFQTNKTGFSGCFAKNAQMYYTNRYRPFIMIPERKKPMLWA